MIDAAHGVEYLHSRQPPVIHGDLHPGNVLIDNDGKAYLCDFGLSRIQHEVTRSRTMIQEGGKLRFLAPELSASAATRFRTTRKSDIFSLAMTFLAAWSGEAPFPEIQNEWKVISNVVGGQRPKRPSRFIFSFTKRFGNALWRLLKKMWKHDPSGRPQGSQVVKRLDQILEDRKGSRGGRLLSTRRLLPAYN
ncbi:kinase-like protein [Clavulina sp. PMI_390]|nr:kinase-like protein [Clavulina sp. PMI_390]